ncbi:MAG: PilZ domain-containing protein [Phycisphaerales bacterium]|nr:PilZ domain-containing protein [Phycisphaerales bacterium]
MSRLPRQQIEHTSPIAKLNADQLHMERRRSPRRPIEEMVTAVFRDGRERFGLTRVILLDSSHTGLGIKADQSFEPGTRFTLTANNVPMPHRSGTVVRCIPCGDGAYSVGVVFDRLKAA